MAVKVETLPFSTSEAQAHRPKFTVLERNLDHEADIPPIGKPQFDLYDCQREGTESLPQLARLILSTMIEEERIEPKRSHRDAETSAFSTRERANSRFLDFVSENEAMSKLSIEFLSGITEKSPESIASFFKERERRSA